MPNNDPPYTFDRVVRMVLTTGAVVGLFLLLRYLSDVLVPFAAAVVLAYLLNPIVRRIEQRTKRRGVAVAATLGSLAILGMIALMIVVPLMGSQFTRFEKSLSGLARALPASLQAAEPATRPADALPPSTQESSPERSAIGFNELVNGWDAFRASKGDKPLDQRFRGLYDEVDGTLIGDIIAHAGSLAKEQGFRSLLFDAAKRLAVGGFTVINFAVNLALGTTVLVVILIYLVFLLLDYNEYARAAGTMLPPKYRDGILEFFAEFESAMRRYFRGQFVVAASVGALSAIGFSIIGLPMAVPFGLFVGLLNMVPYLQIAALVPALLLALLRAIETSSSVMTSLILVLVVFAVVQVIQDAVLVPRIMGKATGLRPVAILLGVFIWGKLLGFFGLLLAIPLTCLGIAYYRRYILTPEHSRILDAEGAMTDPTGGEAGT